MDDKSKIAKLQEELLFQGEPSIQNLCYFCNAPLFDEDETISCDGGDMAMCHPAADANFGGASLKPVKRPCYAYRVNDPKHDYTGEPVDPLEKYMSAETKEWLAKQNPASR